MDTLNVGPNSRDGLDYALNRYVWLQPISPWVFSKSQTTFQLRDFAVSFSCCMAIQLGGKARAMIAHKLSPPCSVQVILSADGLQPGQCARKTSSMLSSGSPTPIRVLIAFLSEATRQGVLIAASSEDYRLLRSQKVALC